MNSYWIRFERDSIGSKQLRSRCAFSERPETRARLQRPGHGWPKTSIRTYGYWRGCPWISLLTRWVSSRHPFA